MEVNEIKNKETWENFLSKCEEKSFLQSWNWGEFQDKMGSGKEKKIWRLGIFDKENLVATALVSKIIAKRGTYLLIQHGPSFALQTEESEAISSPAIEAFKVLLEELKRIGRTEKCSFIRMNPLWQRNKENVEVLKKIGFVESPMHANAYESTWKLDISFPEELILDKMRKTTRYLIRQAQKNRDITIEKNQDVNNIEAYQKLNEEISRKQKFIPFSLAYIKNESDVFLKDGQAIFILGKYKGELAAGALIIFWSGIGFYHQAASAKKYIKYSIPYLIQWEAIKEAKRRGCKLYDFWGYVDPEKNPKHPWAGPTLFKMGFGGKAAEYVKTQDFPLDKKYWLINIFEKIRKIRRRL